LAQTKGQWKRKRRITVIDILAMLGVEAWRSLYAKGKTGKEMAIRTKKETHFFVVIVFDMNQRPIHCS
jgi:hypothetical protein